jgi:hypothetical protein
VPPACSQLGDGDGAFERLGGQSAIDGAMAMAHELRSLNASRVGRVMGRRGESESARALRGIRAA